VWKFTMRRARHHDRAVVGVFMISDHVRLMVSLSFPPGVVNGLGIWWRVGPGLAGTNVNQPTVRSLYRPGRWPGR
jgi:hypothetical protein